MKKDSKALLLAARWGMKSVPSLRGGALGQVSRLVHTRGREEGGNRGREDARKGGRKERKGGAVLGVEAGHDGDIEVAALAPRLDGQVGDDGVGLGAGDQRAVGDGEAVDGGLEGPAYVLLVAVPHGAAGAVDGVERQCAQGGHEVLLGHGGDAGGDEELAELHEVARVGGQQHGAGGGGAGLEDGGAEGRIAAAVVHEVVADGVGRRR